MVESISNLFLNYLIIAFLIVISYREIRKINRKLKKIETLISSNPDIFKSRSMRKR